MNDVDEKLIRCFQAVFSDLTPEEVPQATTETVQAWDSVSMINLLNVIVEEFPVEVDWDNADKLTSYAAVREMILEQDRATS